VANSRQQCPKCGSVMRQGFVVDNTHGGNVVSRWAAGAPVKSFWIGTKLPDEELVPIGAFRCSSCGYLELYARHEFAPE
jgi:predicted nucleic-acid-binding Zn-ribbon protein